MSLNVTHIAMPCVHNTGYTTVRGVGAQGLKDSGGERARQTAGARVELDTHSLCDDGCVCGCTRAHDTVTGSETHRNVYVSYCLS